MAETLTRARFLWLARSGAVFARSRSSATSMSKNREATTPGAKRSFAADKLSYKGHMVDA